MIRLVDGTPPRDPSDWTALAADLAQAIGAGREDVTVVELDHQRGSSDALLTVLISAPEVTS